MRCLFYWCALRLCDVSIVSLWNRAKPSQTKPSQTKPSKAISQLKAARLSLLIWSAIFLLPFFRLCNVQHTHSIYWSESIGLTSFISLCRCFFFHSSLGRLLMIFFIHLLLVLFVVESLVIGACLSLVGSPFFPLW